MDSWWISFERWDKLGSLFCCGSTYLLNTRLFQKLPRFTIALNTARLKMRRISDKLISGQLLQKG
jgi:hypothetical protein